MMMDNNNNTNTIHATSNINIITIERDDKIMTYQWDGEKYDYVQDNYAAYQSMKRELLDNHWVLFIGGKLIAMEEDLEKILTPYLYSTIIDRRKCFVTQVGGQIVYQNEQWRRL